MAKPGIRLGPRRCCRHQVAPNDMTMCAAAIGVLLRTGFVMWLTTVGLYGQWITGFYGPRGGATGEPISAIPWSNYTHIQLFSAGAGSNGAVCMGYLSQSDITAFLASKPVGKKAIVTVGDAPGGYTGSDGVPCGNGTAWAANTDSAHIATFVQNIVTFVNQTGQNNGGFDGVDLDWEASINVSQYVDLINRLRAALPGKLINMDVYTGPPTAVAAAAQASLDQINVMGYDAGNFTRYSWYNGPLFSYIANTSSSMNDGVFQTGGPNMGAVAAGVAPAKVGIGMPFYGYRWMGCTQALVPGCRRQSYFSYGNLVQDTTRWQSQYQRYDSVYKSNYLSISSLNEFDAYNGVEFMPDLVAWAKANGLGGYMTYMQNDEYVSTQTGAARYPLSTALYNAVAGAILAANSTDLRTQLITAVLQQMPENNSAGVVVKGESTLMNVDQWAFYYSEIRPAINTSASTMAQLCNVLGISPVEPTRATTLITVDQFIHALNQLGLSRLRKPHSDLPSVKTALVVMVLLFGTTGAYLAFRRTGPEFAAGEPLQDSHVHGDAVSKQE